MTVFAGHYGSIELKRVGGSGTLDLELNAADLKPSRRRLSFSLPGGLDLPYGTINTGDRIRLTTTDARGLPVRFFRNAANTRFIDNPGRAVLPLEFFANVDLMGAVRMYRTFADAIANTGQSFLAIPLTQNEGEPPWKIRLTVLPGDYNTLGQVTSFTITTDRESVDTTALGNKFRDFSASAISGSGTVDCLFSFKNLEGQETPVAIAQLIQKVDVGSKFAGKFYLLEPGLPQPRGYTSTEGVFYEVDGMFTRSGLIVQSDQIVECSFDFITSGEFKLRVGDSPIQLVTEAGASMGNESTLDALGVLLEEN
jgi:hypothetical protein